MLNRTAGRHFSGIGSIYWTTLGEPIQFTTRQTIGIEMKEDHSPLKEFSFQMAM